MGGTAAVGVTGTLEGTVAVGGTATVGVTGAVGGTEAFCVKK